MVAATMWASFHLLPYFGAIPVDERVVVDGDWVFAAGVTAGIDGALRLAADLRGEDAAKEIQLQMAYAPEPPFNSGTPETAPTAVLQKAKQDMAGIIARREATARRVADVLGVNVLDMSSSSPGCLQSLSEVGASKTAAMSAPDEAAVCASRSMCTAGRSGGWQRKRQTDDEDCSCWTTHADGAELQRS